MKIVKILKIEIDAFGGICNKVIDFADGINLIEADNECGKSTIAAFIRFVFYGFTGVRNQSLYENEKQLYMPWNQSTAGGSIIVGTPGGDFRVDRMFTLPNKESCKIINMVSRQPVFPDQIPGEIFFGVNREVFVKSAFFKDINGNANGDDSLAEQIRNIIFSSDERISTERAVKAIGDAKRSMQNAHNKGLIPDTENQYEQLREECDKSIEINKQVANLILKKTQLETKISEYDAKLLMLENEKNNIEKYNTKLNLERLLLIEKETKAAKAELDNTVGELMGKKIITNPELIALSTDLERKNEMTGRRIKLTVEINETESKLSSIRNQTNIAPEDGDIEKIAKKMKISKSNAIICFITTALSFAAGFVTFIQTDITAAAYICFGIAAAALSSGVYFFVFRSMICKKYHFKTADDFFRYINELPLLLAEANQLQLFFGAKSTELTQLNNTYNDLNSQIENKISDYRKNGDESDNAVIDRLQILTSQIEKLTVAYEIKLKNRNREFENIDIPALVEKARDATVPVRDLKKIEFELSYTKEQARVSREQLDNFMRELAVLNSQAGDPAVVTGKKLAIEERLKFLKSRYQSLDIAFSVLDEASAFMKSTIAPKLTEYASDYFKASTLDKYNNMSLNTKLEISIAVPVERSLDYFSTGTQSVAYLCLRLSLLKLICGTKPQPPIILDDIFAHTDAKRTVALLSVIDKYSRANGNQIFVFTCQSAIKTLLDKMDVKYSKIEL